MKRKFLYLLLVAVLLLGCNGRKSEQEPIENKTETKESILSEKELEQSDKKQDIAYNDVFLNSAIEKGSLGELNYYVIPNNENSDELTLVVLDHNQNMNSEYTVWKGKYYISKDYGVVVIDDSDQPFSNYIRWKVFDLHSNKLITVSEDTKRYVFIKGVEEPYYFENISLISMELKMDEKDGPYLELIYGQANYGLGEFLYWFDYQADMSHSKNEYTHVDFIRELPIEFVILGGNIKMKINNIDTIEVNLKEVEDITQIKDVYYQEVPNFFTVILKTEENNLAEAYLIKVYEFTTDNIFNIELKDHFLYPEEISDIAIVEVSNEEIQIVIDTSTFNYDLRYQVQSGDSDLYLRLSDYVFESRK